MNALKQPVLSGQSSKTIVIWGKNVFVSSVHLLPILREAKKRGARLILIDPVHHRTAGLCDLYLQPRPGSDAAVALACARILLETGGADPEASNYCDHLDQFRDGSIDFGQAVQMGNLFASLFIKAPLGDRYGNIRSYDKMLKVLRSGAAYSSFDVLRDALG